MNKKKLLIVIVVGAMIAIAGCNDGGASGEKLAEDTGANVSGAEIGESYTYEVKVTEKNQYNLVKTNPPFQMENSLERQNLIERYKYLNDRNNVHHVYLMSEHGQVVAYFVAQGKVSSVNSKLTNNKQIVGSNQCIREVHNDAEGGCFKAVESPQMDGSYGTNGDAIFFFTTDGQYVEWNGLYVVSEEPKNIQTEVVLTEKSNSSG